MRATRLRKMIKKRKKRVFYKLVGDRSSPSIMEADNLGTYNISACR